MNRRIILTGIAVALSLLVGACTPPGAPEFKTSPASGSSTTIYPWTGSPKSAGFYVCNAPGAVLEVTLSGLSSEDYIVYVTINHASSGITWDERHDAAPDAAPTFLAGPFTPLPDNACYQVVMVTDFSTAGVDPSHFTYLATW
jgi:hypothetical protein